MLPEVRRYTAAGGIDRRVDARLVTGDLSISNAATENRSLRENGSVEVSRNSCPARYSAWLEVLLCGMRRFYARGAMLLKYSKSNRRLDYNPNCKLVWTH